MTEETITNKKIYSEERETCLYGDATYSWSQLQRGNFYVTDAFVAGVCNLPDEYDEAKYREFVNLYGTHVVIKSDLGTKTIKVFEATTAEFTEFALEQVWSTHKEVLFLKR
ncbi:uncharacterized protein LOC114575943 [Exaiptasia diaphana]|uniref:MACPF domain-containing protein n=1 Tax=Exaiptasia diaphana TaxID=2652724 RepID=A0A913YPZ1_EXADI|nr:uncharacterized protein LOC114575943 [Exaiptasia diaphana]